MNILGLNVKRTVRPSNHHLGPLMRCNLPAKGCADSAEALEIDHSRVFLKPSRVQPYFTKLARECKQKCKRKNRPGRDESPRPVELCSRLKTRREAFWCYGRGLSAPAGTRYSLVCSPVPLSGPSTKVTRPISYLRKLIAFTI